MKKISKGTAVIIAIILLLLFLVCGCGGTAFIYLFSTSGWGKCNLGEEVVYFKDTNEEICSPIGSMIDYEPIPLFTIEVEKNTYDGWTEGQKPAQYYTFIIEQEGQIIDLQGMEATIEVVNISEAEVEFKVNNLALRTGENIGNSGINLNACKDQTFKVRSDERFELYTCTTDFGYNWIITLEKNQ